MDELRREVRSAFARHQAALGNTDQARTWILQRVLTHPKRKRGLFFQLAGAAVTLLVATSIATAVVLIHEHVHSTSRSVPVSLEQALTSGPAAFVSPASSPAFVWLAGQVTNPSPAPSSGSYETVGINVQVIDWTGQVRYHFQIPIPAGRSPFVIQAISADGTRALLDDGSVLDETGRVVGAIPALKGTGMPWSTVRWTNDDRSVCATSSNEPVAPFVTPPPKGQPNPSPTAPEPYTEPGADHSVTLKAFGLDGSVRTIATVGTGPLSVPSGPFGDSTGVLACNITRDLAIVARYHDADANATQSTTYMTVSLWAVKMSTGHVVYHQPETRMALGRAFFFGSQDGSLAVEFLWNSKVWGCETDVALHMPSGQEVPVLDSEPCPDTPAVSADGTRILRRVVNQGATWTALELIDAADGRIIRRVEASTNFGASAVAQPGGSSFIVQVDRYLALVDANGGITLLHPDVVDQRGPGGVSLPYNTQG